MMRRPPGHVAQQRKFLLALATFFLPAFALVDAQQQQQQAPHQEQHEQVGHQIQDDIRPPLAAAILPNSDGNNALFDDFPLSHPKNSRVNTKSPAEGDPLVPRVSVETPKVPRKRTLSSTGKRHPKYENILIPNDASALATLAPDLSVRAPPPLHRAPAAPGRGLASPQSARSLEDWDVEDFVLLATVEGDLYATDRKNGAILWHTQTDEPVVEITHHRLDISSLDDKFSDVDHYIWAVEPNRDGSIYVMLPQGGETRLRDTSLTMKHLVEMTPLGDRNAGIMYMGRKETTMVTLDASTGKVHEWYGSADPESNFKNHQPESCVRPNDFDDNAECPVSGTITLGRTDYIVYVSRTDLSEDSLVATLKYSEWGPNSFDKDLHQQYHSTTDNQYITSKPDGQVYAVNSAQIANGDKAMSLKFRLSAPICRVFDIARPTDAPNGVNPELLVLPQPPPPAEDDEVARLRRASVFVDETKGGSWYALSGSSYPLILSSPSALCTRDGWWEKNQDLDPAQLRRALIGRHSLTDTERRSLKHTFRTLPGGDLSPVFDDDEIENSSSVPTLPPTPTDTPNVIKSLPQVAATRFVDFLSNPFFILAVLALPILYHKELRRWYHRGKPTWKWPLWVAESTKDHAVERAVDLPPEPAEERATEGTAADTGEIVAADDDQQPQPAPAIPEAETGEVDGQNVGFVELNENGDGPGDADAATPEPSKKKGAHRGRRGGVKHRKGRNKRDPSVSQGDDLGPATVEAAVDRAMGIGDVPRQLEPDIMTVPSDVQEISGPILRMGSLEVNEDKQLGTGSNGTVVFAGMFDGRDVAVKRMLIQFYDIASQETRLLRESDDHRNVIRYYAQQQRAAFLYIALELCQASLAEIVEKPSLHRDLAVAGSADIPGVLYQITNGLSHLHSLRIVHRDLKPQNILVNMERDGKPRLLVSDFGLCKKLEGGQSSFGATTAHAAGTSGWRAPELLLDDDVRDSGTALVDASSTHSGSGSLVNSDLLPNRRATRAIDIFSLGLVFFYVLTQGRHPFDCGDRYMREVNIRKGNYNLDALDIVDSAHEAKDLIKSMLSASPKARPNTEEVMAHPYFWPSKKRLNFLCDVSDHFEKEPRDPPSEPLQKLENYGPHVCRGDFLKRLPKDFVESLGKQRKYTGTKLLDLLRALRNKRNHYEDMSDALKAKVGSLPDGYVKFWTGNFPNLLISCWDIGWGENWMETDRFREYYLPTKLG